MVGPTTDYTAFLVNKHCESAYYLNCMLDRVTKRLFSGGLSGYTPTLQEYLDNTWISTTAKEAPSLKRDPFISMHV